MQRMDFMEILMIEEKEDNEECVNHRWIWIYRL